MVKNVEELGTELQVEALGDVRVLDRGEIQLRKSGAGQRVALYVAVGAIDGVASSAVGDRDRGLDEGVGIEVFGYRVRVEVACERWVPVRADGVARIAVARRVVAELGRERESGLNGDDGARGPSAGDKACGSRLVQEVSAGPKGQIVAAIDRG